MIALTMVMGAISFFEIRRLSKERAKKDIVIFVISALCALAIGYYYILNPYGKSFCAFVIDMLGLNE